MKKNYLTAPVNRFVIFVLFISLSVFNFTSCKDDDDQHEENNKGIAISCVTLTRAQIQVWVDSGWTKPDSPESIKELVLQFYNSGKAKSFELVGYPGTSSTNVKDNGKVMLSSDTSCSAKPFSGELIMGNNILKFEPLKIFNSDGTLRKFDYIRFTPEQQYPAYINFKVEIITDGAPEADGPIGVSQL